MYRFDLLRNGLTIRRLVKDSQAGVRLLFALMIVLGSQPNYLYAQEKVVAKISYAAVPDNIATIIDALDSTLPDSIDYLFSAAFNTPVEFRTMSRKGGLVAGKNDITLNAESLKASLRNKAIVVYDMRTTSKTSTNPIAILHQNSIHRIPSEYLIGKPAISILEILDANQFSKVQDAHGYKTVATSTVMYQKSELSQSLADISSIFSAVLNAASDSVAPNPKYYFCLKEIKKAAIKSPCLLVDTIKQDKIGGRVKIHESSVISFRVGVVGAQYSLNNFKIQNQQLVVTPDSTQSKNWKSNLYAIVEFHLPRDLDNFQPIWKSLFENPYPYTKAHNWGFANWLYRITLDRIGVFGGFNISKDPLGALHGGISYAISNSIFLTCGYTWTNQITPQITNVGNITNLADAELYAKRKYTRGVISWGLSFSPSAVLQWVSQKSTKK